MTTSQPKVWSLWIYDRHCSLIFHADWSSMHTRNTPSASTAAAGAGASGPDGPSSSSSSSSASTAQDPTSSRLAAGASGTGAAGASKNSALPLHEQAKLVYGVVFSLRNIVRKLSPLRPAAGASASTSASASASAPGAGAGEEKLNSYSTSRYTLSHVQTPTQYTFVMLSDPIAAQTKRAPPPLGAGEAASSAGPSTGIVVGGTGGIPGTGGMSTTGVLQQIVRGPWVEFVARNPGLAVLERAPDSDDEEDADEDEGEGEKRRAAEERRKAEGLGISIDSELFRAAVERVLAQNKLSAPRI
ncbi:hypothetical protein FA10DRAFT_267128 [Acaromyces ingoldii]|uniref:Trafficking protein particle complex subunit n=1 Tax=Acaromyces ingoldii TaxID=215250 RepID=A0A316YMB1_9BASI|nr:hypothetical protein FA10DRAFT_267128 [Acaromyces ingoldii]PWN90680.1 hypothetical protein FA10DRAFT_267128 [Acaromyces ingoldii]